MSLKKGIVEKKGSLGGYAKRAIMLGTSCLLIFRDTKFNEFVNCILLTPEDISLHIDSSTTFTLCNKDKSLVFHFRCSEVLYC